MCCFCCSVYPVHIVLYVLFMFCLCSLHCSVCDVYILYVQFMFFCVSSLHCMLYMFCLCCSVCAVLTGTTTARGGDKPAWQIKSHSQGLTEFLQQKKVTAVQTQTVLFWEQKTALDSTLMAEATCSAMVILANSQLFHWQFLGVDITKIMAINQGQQEPL